jgi:hypothetical protein
MYSNSMKYLGLFVLSGRRRSCPKSAVSAPGACAVPSSGDCRFAVIFSKRERLTAPLRTVSGRSEIERKLAVLNALRITSASLLA